MYKNHTFRIIFLVQIPSSNLKLVKTGKRVNNPTKSTIPSHMLLVILYIAFI